MKKVIIILALSLVFVKLSHSQSVCDVFSATEINWYGLDFTYTKLVGPGFTDPQTIRDQFMDSWNNLVIKEAKKYDIKKFFKKKSVQYKLDVVNGRNIKVDYNKMVSLNSNEPTEVDEQKINSAIKEYSTGTDKGIGLAFFVEAFDKYKERAIISVVFFDVSTKKIFFIKRLKGAAGGVGLRNYWAGAIYKIMLQCEEDFKRWEKEICIK